MAAAVAVGLVAAVPALREMALVATAKVILLVASPTEPEIIDLEALDAVSVLIAADGSLMGEVAGDERRSPVDLADLPDHVVHAILAAEDARFYEHEGVDPTGVYRALLRTSQGTLQGGSTISQQLAKLNFTTGERSYARKFKEIQYVRRLERTYSKDALLERYVNQIYFGEQAYGLAAAARSFFGVTPDELTVAQAALLAGKIREPEGLDPRREPQRAAARRNQVLANMVKHGWLAEKELGVLTAQPVELSSRPQQQVPYAPHFVELVKRETATIAELGPDAATRATRVATGGLRIETTLDRRLFDATVASVSETLGQAGDPNAAVASVEPGTGAIRSIFGGLDFARTEFDVASRGGRQPGSAFKPFVYMAALEAGIDPRSEFDGRPAQKFDCYGDAEVRNYAGEDADGSLDLDSAMARSVNVTFVEVGCLVGVRSVLDVASRAGIPDDARDPVPAVFLGGLSRGVTALSMAEAYATFAAEGRHAASHAVTRITDRDGAVIYERSPRTEQVFDPARARVLNQALSDVVRRGTARAAQLGRPAAGKTGTTTENRDAWFVGYVPQVATAVWVGYEPPAPMQDVRGRSVTGGSFPAQIFARLMTAGLEGMPVAPLPVGGPDGLGLTVRTTSTTSTTVAPPPAGDPATEPPPAPAPGTAEPPP